MPFQVYLISFAVQWNSRMESLRVAGGKERQSSCVDPRRIQLLNQQSELLFGREHLFKPDFTAPMPLPQSYTSPDEEELLGVEYALCQSTNFASREYYISQVEKEQPSKTRKKKNQMDLWTLTTLKAVMRVSALRVTPVRTPLTPSIPNTLCSLQTSRSRRK
ncbi:uncharacterized protein LOC105357792 isoform X2 [Oryzias latipes]|uniref:uncharacterized protein LOC105357792 isoform X2 n=1 Tax=Oryzias latipes TaxID=8090 RepID=UPI0005CC3BE5|nr:uncharacterized protein LOC105357792 isoform X2 [Oryzias latipes]